jgi:hypothetical protein
VRPHRFPILRPQPPPPQTSLPPHPSGNVPRCPGLQVAGVQHEPLSAQTSVPLHVKHVMAPPQPSLIE